MKLLVLLGLFSEVKCHNDNHQPIINQALHHVTQHEQAKHQLNNFLESQPIFEDIFTNQFEKYKEQLPSLKCLGALYHIRQNSQLSMAKCKSFIHLFIHSFIHSLIHSFIQSFIQSFIHSFIH